MPLWPPIIIFIGLEDEGVVSMRTTPFPDIVHETLGRGLYLGLTPSPREEESLSGDTVTLSPDSKETHVVHEPGFDLTDAMMAPMGGSSIYWWWAKDILCCFNALVLQSHKSKNSIATFINFTFSSLPLIRHPVPLQTHHRPVHSVFYGGSTGLSRYWGCDCESPAATGSLWKRFSSMWCWLAQWPDSQVTFPLMDSLQAEKLKILGGTALYQ